MLRGISSSPIQLHHKTFPDISNFAYLQVQDSHSNTSPFPYYESSNVRYKRRTKREPTSVSDALSSNITEILESLLKDYDKTERPAYNKGKYKMTKSCFIYNKYFFIILLNFGTKINDFILLQVKQQK